MSLLSRIKYVFAEKPVAKPETQEFDTIQRRVFETLVINGLLENPDKVLEKQGRCLGIELYDEMIRLDPEITAALNTRKLAVRNKPWEIISNDAPEDIISFAKDLIKNLANVDSDINNMLTALERGFSVQEIMWTVKEGKWFVSDLKDRDQKHYVFDENYQIRLLTKDHPSDGEVVPENKFVVHTHDKKRENPYGNSVLQSLYWPFYFWKNSTKFWSLFVQRFGMPTVLAIAKTGSIASSVRTEIENFLKDLQANSYGVGPGNVDYEFKEPSADGTAYRAYMDYWDTKKRLVILGQTMTSDVGSKGALATATVHNDIRNEIVVSDAKEVSATITQQLLIPAIKLNFAYDGPMPEFKIKAEPEEDLVSKSDVDQKMSNIGVQFTWGYINKTYGYPIPTGKTTDDLVERQQQSNPLNMFGGNKHDASFSEQSNREKLEAIALQKGRDLFIDWPELIDKKKVN